MIYSGVWGRETHAITLANLRAMTPLFAGSSAEDTSCLKLDHENWLIVQAQAAKVGSWKGIEPFDVAFNAEVAAGKKNIEAFGCLPQLDEILNIKADGGEEDTTSIKCPITSPDFVKINGVPYLTSDEGGDL